MRFKAPRPRPTKRKWAYCVLPALALSLLAIQPPAETPDARSTVIVQGTNAQSAAEAVAKVGGTVTHELGIIGAVGARVTPAQRETLEATPSVRRIWLNHRTAATGKGGGAKGGGAKGGGDDGDTTSIVPDTVFPSVVGAPATWARQITGYGVTVAVVDASTKYTMPGLKADAYGFERNYAYYDAINDQLWKFPLGKRDKTSPPGDAYGHGTHVTGIIANSTVTPSGDHGGIAPNVGLVVVRALGDDGSGTYADVIRAIDWVVDTRHSYGTRVINLSLSAPPRSYYWDDPLNQAVMNAWQAGIVVVASAGNGGPSPMTIGVPGNVPYIITVGAMSDAVTPETPGDDFLTSFSAAGPTVEGFIKPEIVAPGGHIISNMQDQTSLATQHSIYQFGDQYFQMSGTSQASAVVTGVVALMLERNPFLTPDQVKCRLMASARPAVTDSGTLAYSVFQQGAGMVSADGAVLDDSLPLDCANRGLNLAADLTGAAHFGGRANQSPDGSYYVMGLDGDGFMWSDGFPSSSGFAWSDAFMWSDGFAWSDAFMWSDGLLWSDGRVFGEAFVWNDSFVWSDSVNWGVAPMAVNAWVEQE